VSFGSIVLAALSLDVPIALGNDADLGALAEHRRGTAVGVGDLVYLSGNVGVGAGVMTGGQRLEGVAGYAGEIGHLNHDPRGLACHCGSRGCWETVVGAPAIAEALRCPADQVARLGDILDDMSSAPRELRPIAMELGRGLAAVVNIFNPSVVILGGYFLPLFRLCRTEVTAGLTERALMPARDSVRLTLPGLGNDSVLLGAAEMALEPVFVDPVASLAAAVTDASARLAG
jgi:predicted NBD/HSP70 family sugar kinase